MNSKICRTCNISKPESDFSITNKARGYTYPHCKACCAAKKRQERQADPQAYAAYQREYYFRPENHDHLLERAREANLRHYHKMRDEVLDGLGGCCSLCGYSEREVLQIDHIGGGGAKHRTIKGAHGALRQIWHLCKDDPESARLQYQALCANCHHLKSYPRRSPQ